MTVEELIAELKKMPPKAWVALDMNGFIDNDLVIRIKLEEKIGFMPADIVKLSNYK